MVLCDLDHAIILFRCEIHVIVARGVVVLAPYNHFVMEMRAGRFTGVSYFTNHLATGHLLTYPFLKLIEVPIKGLVAIAVVDNETVAIALSYSSGVRSM